MPDEINAIIPRNNPRIVGHKRVAAALIGSYNSGKMPNAFLFCGSKGIGKATLAYHFARFLLSDSFIKDDIIIDKSDPVFMQIEGGSNPNFLCLQSESGDIKVEQARKINDFLRLSASGKKHRVILIDSIDQMNNNAQNAILKLLEEPPTNCVFLLINHASGKILPTIKSRCRPLMLSKLDINEVSSVLLNVLPDVSQSGLKNLSKLADGAPGFAVLLHENDGVNLFETLKDAVFSASDVKKQQNLISLISGKANEKSWEIFTIQINILMTNVIKNIAANNEPCVTEGSNLLKKNEPLIEKNLDELIKVWEKVNSLMRDTNRINLDKKAVIVGILRELHFLGRRELCEPDYKKQSGFL